MGIEYRTLTGAAGTISAAQFATDLTLWSNAPQYSPPVTNSDGTQTRRAYAPAVAGPRVQLRVRFTQD